MSSVEIHAKYDKLVDPKTLKDHPKNRNKHGSDQIERLAKLYEYHGIRHPIVISSLSGCIVAGHGRKLAAIRAGLAEVPVVIQDFDSTESEYAFIQSDNAIAAWAELDLAGINADLGDLGPDFDLDMLGIKDFKMDFELDVEDLNDYSKNIKSPVYQPTGPKPEVTDLFDYKKTDEIIQKIDKSNLPLIEKEFLKLAAYRHIVFNYENIAEYYAHSDLDTQALMEDSALVIIDFEKAIENGFVKLKKEISDSLLNDDEEDSE